MSAAEVLSFNTILPNKICLLQCKILLLLLHFVHLNQAATINFLEFLFYLTFLFVKCYVQNGLR